ncbi:MULTISPECIES: type II secretion system protein [unclassified Variovorax]|uniref:type II secretion system protein n=1 Tax=unclassified Variovorax TaxID=663243 RepID=UPI001315BC12|nr:MULTISPECIES: type II secretion system protein [unclassified Variovorax]VTU41565.1 hypothetical protein SRS16P1_00035 [Variovorax sp. SRS16]VTU41591.1 hypothetical protein E5P1_00035 [Variovorax sp. PBL-E5]VTU44783.1 hypothetical protein H6P1_00899 [Variovorax sp. PBL-H6]
MLKSTLGARRQRGFSLPEVLIALSVITIVSFMVIGAVGPWLGLKQNIDNDRRMQDIRQGLQAVYETRAYEAETLPAGQFFGLVTSTIDGAGNCNLQSSAFRQLNTLISDAGAQAAKDGYGNAWCVFVSGQLQKPVDGTTLYYRNISIVSAGSDSLLAPGTRMAADGLMNYSGDDVGITVSGYDVQYPKLKETLRRMSRVATSYEAYFSMRFLSYADRDITRDYFSQRYDASSAVASTEGGWANADALLANIGVSASDAFTAWERNNNIIVANYDEQLGSQRVRSPATTGTGILPYTAILAARVPAPAGVDLYVTRVAVGNY